MWRCSKVETLRQKFVIADMKSQCGTNKMFPSLHLWTQPLCWSCSHSDSLLHAYFTGINRDGRSLPSAGRLQLYPACLEGGEMHTNRNELRAITTCLVVNGCKYENNTYPVQTTISEINIYEYCRTMISPPQPSVCLLSWLWGLCLANAVICWWLRRW